jgi:hypothetical protein
MFTLLADIETRNAALFEYMKEQGGVTDEKLAPYLDRAAAASECDGAQLALAWSICLRQNPNRRRKWAKTRR